MVVNNVHEKKSFLSPAILQTCGDLTHCKHEGVTSSSHDQDAQPRPLSTTIGLLLVWRHTPAPRAVSGLKN
jgi:hypothetical protein